MNHARTLFALGLALAVAGNATDESKEEVRLNYERLDLTDGRRLKNVVVRFYDAKSEKLLVVADGKALVIPISLVPAPMNQSLKRAPASGETVNTVPAVVDPAAVAGRTTPPPVPSAMRPVNPEVAPSNLKQHQQVARVRARRYFEFELGGVPDTERIDRLDLEVGLPAPVAGWMGRYRTEGKVFVEYLDWRSLRSRRLTSTFEVTTEQKPGEEIKVVDFTRKS